MQPVAYVLARAAEDGFIEAIRPASQRFDPLLRGSICKKARDAFAQASTSTKIGDEKHKLRLAFLNVIGRAPSPDDAPAVQAAFDEARAAYPKRNGVALWPVTIPLAAGAGVLAIAIAAVALWPTPRERFGRSALGEGMSKGLTDFVVGVSNHRFEREKKGREVLLSNGVKRQIGDSAFALLGSALDQARDVLAAETPTDARDRRDKLAGTLGALDVALGDEKLPAFFDAYVESDSFGTGVWLMGYYVDDRATVSFGGATFPVVWGRRTDDLNLEVGGKVYESQALGGFVVSIDDVEQWTIRTVIPALAKGAPFSPAGKEAEGRFATKAGEKVRGELCAAAELSPEDADEMASVFAQRHEAFQRLATLGDELYEPRGLRLSIKLQDALARRQDEVDAKEIRSLEDRLARLEKAFDRVIVAQALIDETRFAAQSTCAKASCKMILDDDLKAALAQDELGPAASSIVAGKLAAIARTDKATALALAEAEIGTGGYLTVWLVERELGLSPGWMARGGIGDTGEHNQLGAGALDRSAADLRKAAEGAYAKAFGAPMPALARNKTTARR